MIPCHTSDLQWLSVSDIAREYDRTPTMIRVWCRTGFIITLGYHVRKDHTGHWLIGVPPYLATKIENSETQSLT